MPETLEVNTQEAKLGRALLGYVPAVAADYLLKLDGPLSEPHQDDCECAVLFADISGFTALTERLAERGPEGVETLTRLLNDYFGQMVDKIEAQGGDVVKFAGDALLAIWRTDASQSLRDAVRVASQCAISVQGTLKDYRAADGERLSLKVAVGAGDVRAFHVGGVFGRWEFVIAGDPVNQVEAVNSACAPGDVGISSAALAVVEDSLRCTPLNAECYRIDASIGHVDAPDVPAHTVADSQIKQLKSHIPAAIHQRLEAGQSVWLAELRRITVLFVNLPALTDSTPIDEANRVMRTLQTALYSQEGSVNKLSVDDKGVSLIGALGLPPLAHNDDPVRGVLAALAIQADLQRFGWECSIGVTTGRVFCGTIGNDRRREYTIMGDTVNLSARLMQSANGSVLCDEPTYAQAQHLVLFTQLEPLTVKGKFSQTAVFQPIEPLEREDDAADLGFVGRYSERGALVDAFARLRAGDGAAAVVEGAPGVGKTRFAAELVRAAQANDIRVVRSAAAHAQRTTPYFVWSAIFQQLLGISSTDSPAEAEQKLLRQIASVDELVRLAPLFNSILPVELAPTTLTAQMDNATRRDALLNLSINLLHHLTVERPLISILEDGQWMDDASWLLLERVAKEVRWMLPIVMTRPLNPPVPAGYVQLQDLETIVKVTLAPLNREETIALAKERLSVRALKVDLADLIHLRTQGNPFFLEAFLESLSASGSLEVVDGAARLSGTDSTAATLPDSLEALVMERLDRLPAPIQLTLKVASVIGERFTGALLDAVYPVPDDRHLLRSHLAELRDLGLLQEIDDAEDTFGFRNATVRDVTYNLMLFSQRRQLHADIAASLEENFDGQSSGYALLAHHFDNASDEKKTIKYCALAGANASANFANREAIGFYSRALELDAEQAGSDPYQRAQWEEALGNAYYAQGDFDLSLKHLERALLVYDRALPKSRGALAQRVGMEAIRHTLSLISGADGKQTVDLRLACAARIYTRLGQLHYLNNDKLRGIYAALRGLNLAIRSGSALEMSRHFANMTIVAGLVRMHKLAERYYQHATRNADAADDDGARAYVLNVVGLYRVTQGQWGAVEQCLQPAQELALRIGHHRRWEETAMVLVTARYRRGELRTAHKLARLLYQSGRRRAVASVQCWGLAAQIVAELALAADATATAEKLAPLLSEKIPKGDQLLVHGLLAKVAHINDDNQRAWEHARAAQALMRDSDTTAQYVLEGYAGVAEFAHGLLKANKADSEARELSRMAVDALAMFAKLYPVGRPLYHLCHGQQQWYDGAEDDARATWLAGLDHAKQLQMGYEMSQLHSHLADHAVTKDEAKRHYVLARTYEGEARATDDGNDVLDKVTKTILWI